MLCHPLQYVDSCWDTSVVWLSLQEDGEGGALNAHNSKKKSTTNILFLLVIKHCPCPHFFYFGVLLLLDKNKLFVSS